MSLSNVMLFRARVKPDKVAAVEAGARTIFSALEAGPPIGIRYAATKCADGVNFLILLGVEDGSDNPLFALPAYREFIGNLRDWLEEPASQEPLSVVGSYNLF
jgi:hypothetical protein